MTISTLTPAYIDAQHLAQTVKTQGYGVLSPTETASLIGCPLKALDALKADWNNLPRDEFLKDGGRYRSRRHASFIIDDETIFRTPHRAHYQPLAYNALHGGMHRRFEPVLPHIAESDAWQALLRALAKICSDIRGARPWFVEAHQFRIDTKNGIGRPTPEGAHRDGVDFVAILLVARKDVSGGESRIFEAEGPNGQRFTLSDPWTLLLLDDLRVIHESTPIQPTAEGGYRDTLVLTFRTEGFLEEV